MGQGPHTIKFGVAPHYDQIYHNGFCELLRIEAGRLLSPWETYAEQARIKRDRSAPRH